MSIRQQYMQFGVDRFYQTIDNYTNPHAEYIKEILASLYDPSWTTAIDFGCGDGLVTSNISASSIGVDKYLTSLYVTNTNRPVIEASFEDVACGRLELPHVDVIICSYCLDLVEKSIQHQLFWALAQSAFNLITIRPNKHTINSTFWTLQNTIKIGKSVGQYYQRSS